jgi:hypothetical protein
VQAQAQAQAQAAASADAMAHIRAHHGMAPLKYGATSTARAVNATAAAVNTRVEVRSIHWSPYDPVAVVNAVS